MPILTNVRHELFAQAIAKGADLAVAYEQAGFRRRVSNASRLRTNDKVSARVTELLNEAAQKTSVTVERVLQEIANIAFLDIRDAANWGEREIEAKPARGRRRSYRKDKVDFLDIKPSDKMPEGVARAIQMVKMTKFGVEVRAYNKLDALVKLGVHLGMFKEKDESKSGIDALMQMIEDAHEAATENLRVIEGPSRERME